MGLHHLSRLELASVDMAWTHGGQPDLWPKCRRTLARKRAHSCFEHPAPFLASQAPNWSELAKCNRGRPFRSPSVACRIRGVGGRAQRHPLNVLRTTEFAGLRPLYRGAFVEAVRAGNSLADLRADVETHVGDVAFRVSFV